ncbi:phBC6A51 family helix-turn-helix protein [Bacillus sp. JJ1532]|uniref:phBC6A51 family helix-turn-helix protein n=1 Tax=Bacillus sp. JJ1532 TaxID=3122958 RepID=UPI002FFFF045
MSNELEMIIIDGLTSQQNEAAILEAYGGMDRSTIAKTVGVSRTTYYQWLKKPEMMTAIDKYAQEKKNLAKSFLLKNLDKASETLAELMNSKDDSIRLKAADRILQYGVGKPSSSLHVTSDLTNVNHSNTPKDILDMEDEEFESRLDEYEDE